MNVGKIIAPFVLPICLLLALLYLDLTSTQKLVIWLVLIGYTGGAALFILAKRR